LLIRGFSFPFPPHKPVSPLLPPYPNPPPLPPLLNPFSRRMTPRSNDPPAPPNHRLPRSDFSVTIKKLTGRRVKSSSMSQNDFPAFPSFPKPRSPNSPPPFLFIPNQLSLTLAPIFTTPPKVILGPPGGNLSMARCSLSLLPPRPTCYKQFPVAFFFHISIVFVNLCDIQSTSYNPHHAVFWNDSVLVFFFMSIPSIGGVHGRAFFFVTSRPPNVSSFFFTHSWLCIRLTNFLESFPFLLLVTTCLYCFIALGLIFCLSDKVTPVFPNWGRMVWRAFPRLLLMVWLSRVGPFLVSFRLFS